MEIGTEINYDGETYIAADSPIDRCHGCAFHSDDALCPQEDCCRIIWKLKTEQMGTTEKKTTEQMETTEMAIEAFDRILGEMSELHARKNADYGNAFADSFREFGMVSAVIRLNDNMNRLKALTKQDAQVKTESIRNTLIDLACYAVMTIEELDKQK